MKFITTKNEDEQEEIFVFPTSVDHDAMAEVLGCIKTTLESRGRECGENLFLLDL